MAIPKPAIEYKEFYNKDRSLPEPRWGGKVEEAKIQCPWCNSQDMYYSAHPNNPEEVFSDPVRCKSCGHISDWFEAFKQRVQHPTDTPREIIRGAGGARTNQISH